MICLLATPLLSHFWKTKNWKHLTLFFFFNFILFLNFAILYWFCQISKWIHHRYTCVPHPEPSSLLPPHTIPLGRPCAPAPSIQHLTLKGIYFHFLSLRTFIKKGLTKIYQMTVLLLFYLEAPCLAQYTYKVLFRKMNFNIYLLTCSWFLEKLFVLTCIWNVLLSSVPWSCNIHHSI